MDCADSTSRRSSAYASRSAQLVERHPGHLVDLDVLVARARRRRPRAGSGARSCGCGGPRRRTSSRWCRAAPAPGRGCRSPPRPRGRRRPRRSRRPRGDPWAATTAAGRAGRGGRSARPRGGAAAVDDEAAGGGLLDLAQPPPRAAGRPGRRSHGAGHLVERSRGTGATRRPVATARAVRPVRAPRLSRRRRDVPRSGARTAWPPVSDPSLAACPGDLRRCPPRSGAPSRELLRVAPVADELGRAVRGGRAPALALVGGLGARRAARPAAAGPRLRDRRPTGADRWRSSDGWADAVWEVGIAFGTVGLPQGRLHHRDHDVPQRGLRPGVAQAGGDLRRHPRGRPRSPRLHRQRDGGAAAGAAVRRPVRRAARPRRADAAHARATGGLLRRRPAADDAGGAVRGPARLRRRTRGRRGDDAPWPSASTSSPPSGFATSWSSCCCRRTRGAGLALLVDTGLAEHVLPELPRLRAGDRRAPPAQGRLRAHADRPRAGDRLSRPPGEPGPRAAARRADARRRQAQDPPLRARRRRVLPPPRGRRRQADPKRGLQALRFPQGRHRRRARAGRAAPALPRLRREASGPTRPYGATSAMPARCSRGCTR